MDRYWDSDIKFLTSSQREGKEEESCALVVNNWKIFRKGYPGWHSMPSLEGQKFQIKLLWEQQLVKYSQTI